MRRGVFVLSFVFILLVVIGFASAQSSLSDLLSSIDQSSVTFLSLFIISFGLLFFALSKMFKDNIAIAGIISAMLSFLLVFYVNKAGIDFSGFFFDIGISEVVIAAVLPFIIIGGAILIIVTLKKYSWFAFGGILLVTSIFIYERLLTFVLGVILLFIGLIVAIRKKGGREIRIPLR